MANRTTYEIIAKTKGFKNSDTQVKGLTSSLGGLSTKLMGVAGAYFGSRALLDGISASVSAFAKQELAEKKLEQALGKTSTALLDQASAMQKVTTFGDEAIIMQQAFLGSIGMTEDQIKDILPVAADLAAATGLTLESAVRNTAKTFSGLAGELGELVPQIRELTAEEMKAGKAVEVMGELFDGVARTSAFTLEGQLERVKNEMGDMAEEIGEKLSPVVSRLAFEFLKFRNALPEEELIQARIDGNKKALDQYDQEMEIIKSRFGEEFAEKLLLDEIAGIKTQIKEDEETLAILRQDGSYLIIQDQELTNFVKLTQAQQKRNKEKKDEVAQDKIEAKLKKQRMMDTTATSIAALQTLSSAVAADSHMTKGLTIAQAVADTYAGANKALASAPPPLNFAQAALVVASGLANVSQINKAYQGAQYGFDGVVTEPTQFTVGESGAEMVSVTPLEGVDNAGAGQGMTVNITGNVMSDEFVEEELAERIADAVRRGVDFGMS